MRNVEVVIVDPGVIAFRWTDEVVNGDNVFATLNEAKTRARDIVRAESEKWLSALLDITATTAYDVEGDWGELRG